jgi:DNA polymerase-3 subunit alpha
LAEPDFVHLHVHSEYSLLDGANRIPDLIESAKKDGQRAMALTDHGNLFGSIEHYQACTAAGLRPILGCEVYVARRSRFEPHSKAKGNGYHHLTLLARNEEGWKNLMLLASSAYLEGLHFRPRIDRELLARHAKGISCLSGCLASELSQLCIQGKEDEAETLAATWSSIFGREHFWLELQRNGIETQTRVNETLTRIRGRTGIPLVATNDIHYLRNEDCAAHDVLLCINTGAKRSDAKRFRFETETLYFTTRAEMGEMFRDVPEAIAATMDVAEQVDLSIEFGRYRLPVFRPDSGESAEALFDRLLAEGMARLYGDGNAAAKERLAYERRVIAELGFVSYFLIVWDLIRWARENGIPVGPGRGSAAGSIVAYLLGITKVDPLKYDLLFERFLNSARVSMPDIDIDFCKDGRPRVLEYTRKRYGQDRVAQIITFNTMASRAVVRDVGRALDVPLAEVDRITKKIPAGPTAPPLAEALEKDADLKALREARPELADVFRFSIQLEGLARNISTHAAGVVISDEPVTNYVPLAKNGDDVVTQWTMTQLEALGLLKMDYLGLRTLTILEKTLRNIEKQGGAPPDLDRLPEGDRATYAMLGEGDTLGVFQLESEGMRKLIGRAKPDCFEDLIAILALYRPGPLESGMVETFIKRKHGEEPIAYAHPSLEPILRDTYGSLVYQEQVMLIANRLGDLSLLEADNLRKAMGKKKPEIMQKFAEQFIAGAKKNGCKDAVAREIWDHMVKFGGYGFNKSHSTAYAVITYQTAYLKANHRPAFLAANFSCEMGDSDKVRDFLDDARAARIPVLPPDVAHSVWEFETEGAGIRFGFGAIKGTGERAIETLVAARARVAAAGSRIGLHELAGEVDSSEVGRLNWEALIKAGAFDSTGMERGAAMAALDGAISDGARRAADRRSGQGALFGSDSPPAEIPRPRNGAEVAGPAWSRADTLRAEFEVLGFYLTGHPLEERGGLLSLLSSVRIDGLGAIAGGSEVIVAGLVLGKSEALVKTGRLAGKRMARFRLEDLTGHVAVTVFPRTWEECGKKIEDGAVLVCRAKLEERAEEPALLLEEALTLDEALKRFAGCVVVRIGTQDAEVLPSLRAAIEKHRGKSPLYFQVTGEDGATRRVRAGNSLGVSISEGFAREIDAVLGKGRVSVARM